MTRSHRTQHRAFTVPEMLVALVLMGIFALAAAQLFHAVFVLSRDTVRLQNTTASFNSAVAVMRSDVWRAREIKTDNTGAIVLTIGQSSVRWTVDAEHMTRSDASGSAKTWTPPTAMSAVMRPESVVLRIAGTKNSPAGEIWLPREAALVEGVTQ